MTNPNIQNLRKRAKAFGLVVTKASDAWVTGYCEYVLHKPGADWENMRMISLIGVKNEIERLEKRA